MAAPPPSVPASPGAAPVPKAPQYPSVPAQLPNVKATSAAELCKSSEPNPAAQKLLTPQQTPSQYLNTLQDHQMGDEMVKTLAHGMPDREGVAWATQSADKVSGHLQPADTQALQAAKTWVAKPSSENQAAAAVAAAKTDHQGPGAWAAQGAAWSEPAGTAGPRLTPMAVSSSVLLSSSISANPSVAAPKTQAVQAPASPPPVPGAAAPEVPPEAKAHTFQAQYPFIAKGIDIASGKTPV